MRGGRWLSTGDIWDSPQGPHFRLGSGGSKKGTLFFLVCDSGLKAGTGCISTSEVSAVKDECR